MADAIIVRLFKVTEAVLRAAPILKVIGKHGVGVDNVDLPAATRRGIPVVFTPSAQTMANAVAEHAVQMMLALARQTVAADRLVREARFEDRRSLEGIELSGKTLGVVGFGVIGAKVAEICHADSTCAFWRMIRIHRHDRCRRPLPGSGLFANCWNSRMWSRCTFPRRPRHCT